MLRNIPISTQRREAPDAASSAWAPAAASGLLVGGGEHMTALPEQSLLESALDVAVLGEGEEVMALLAQAVAAGEPLAGVPGIAFKDAPGSVQRGPRHARIRDIDAISLP